MRISVSGKEPNVTKAVLRSFALIFIISVNVFIALHTEVRVLKLFEGSSKSKFHLKLFFCAIWFLFKGLVIFHSVFMRHLVALWNLEFFLMNLSCDFNSSRLLPSLFSLNLLSHALSFANSFYLFNFFRLMVFFLFCHFFFTIKLIIYS